jgi:2-keto-4-pentenoate hydratase/2-oxohepta-3-ene-1,7-dioic acid hydratase in catechol pathway
MRIATYEQAGQERIGIVEGGTVFAVVQGVSVIDLLAAGPAERERFARAARAAAETPLAEVRLRAPLQPPTIRDFVTFEQHVEGAVKNGSRDAEIHPHWYQAPRFFWINPYSVVGPDDPVEVPPGCSLLDLELELAAIIGRSGRDLTQAQARDHIAGYTILNDWSARDLQMNEMPVGMGPSKGKDFATTLGPWIVTADELEPYRRDDRLHLRMTARINGAQLGGGDTSASMAWSFEDLVAHSSRGAWVRPGDVIGSGTAGAGCLFELWGRSGRREPPPLAAGDVVTLEVEAIGTVSNQVVSSSVPGVVVPPARRRAPGRV